MKSNRVMRLLAILGALVLILAACGDDDAVDTTEGAVATTEAAPDTTEAAPETTEAPAGPPEAGPLGAVTVAPGDPIEIRSLEAISGAVAFLGIPNERATQMAINDFGQIKGFDVNMGVGLDDLCSGEGGQAAAQTIVADEQVVGVIG
ncbi:MAG: hypothetical protein O7C01_11270, partial [Actinobacteria bacterium]|nr:hypothetical protein [Actinomycetota bacterium]